MSRTSLLLPLALWSFTCAAHGSADNHLQIMLVDDRIKMNITIDMRVLQAVDEDLDGYAGLAELRVTIIDAESGLRFRLRDPMQKQTVPAP